MSYFVSPRGRALLLRTIPRSGDKPVLTAECYSKWYSLFLVYRIHDEVAIDEVPFPEDATGKLTPYIDHVPNPLVVDAWAKEKGYELDELAVEIMIGRWLRARRGARDQG